VVKIGRLKGNIGWREKEEEGIPSPIKTWESKMRRFREPDEPTNRLRHAILKSKNEGKNIKQLGDSSGTRWLKEGGKFHPAGNEKSGGAA